MAVNPKLREQLAHNGRPHRVRCRFNLDRRLYKQRLLLSAAAIAGMVLTAMLVGRWSVFLLPLVVSILICLVLSFYSYRMLKVRQPVIAIGRNGIWDRRLGGSVIPWTEILRVRTDRFGNIILDPWREFSGRAMTGELRLTDLLRRVDPSLNPGSVRIRVTDVDGETWDVLAAIEASLPDYLRSLWRPETRRRLFVGDTRKAAFGAAATAMAIVLMFAAFGGAKDQGVVLHSLGPATDIGATPGRKDSPIVHLYRHAAQQGDLDARMRLGLMFHEGDGVARDPAQAAHWFRLAATEKLPAGEAALGYLHEQGMGVEQNFGQALTWYREAAGKNHAWAQYRLGMMYRDGRGVPRDNEKAVALLRAAADQGDVSGLFHLGEMYENGWGTAQDPATASEWYRKAAEQNHDRAEYNLAVMYRDGRGVARDAARAGEWFERSARTGYAPAQYAIGLAYEVGSGVPIDRNRAALWYHVAERHGHAEASNRRKHLLEGMTPQERRDADLFLRDWMQGNLLKGDVIARFEEYREKPGAKAFAVSMNGAWAQTEAAPHVRDAVYQVMKRCREYAATCFLYAVGDAVVAGMRDAEVDAIVARQIKTTARR
jgi:TPR repeat protein